MAKRRKGLASSLDKSWENDGINRNRFDVSYTSFLTARLGRIYPIFLQDVSPNEHYTINESSGFDFRYPLVGTFPPHIRCHRRYYYVRNRTLFDKWDEFTMQDPLIKASAIAHPVIDKLGSPLFQTGGLGDYLNMPTIKTATKTIQAHIHTYVEDELWKDQAIDGETTHGLNYWRIKKDSEFYYPLSGAADPTVSSSHEFSELQGHVGCGSASIVRGLVTEPFWKRVSSEVSSYLLEHSQTYRGSEKPVSDGNGFYYGHDTFFESLPLPVADPGSAEYVDWELPYIATYHKLSSSAKFYSIWNNMPDFSGRIVIYTGDSLFNAVPSDLAIDFTGVYRTQLPSGISDRAFAFPDNFYSTPVIEAASGTDLDQCRILRTMTFRFPSSFITKLRRLQSQTNCYILLGYNQLAVNMSLELSYFARQGMAAGTFETSDQNHKYSVVGGFCNCWHYPAEGQMVQNESLPTEVSVLALRCYEAVTNTMRHPIIEPFMIDGKIAVDRYCTFMGEGATPGEVDFYLENSPNGDGFQLARYPDDLFTTMIPSPTMGDHQRPLIGMTIVDAEHARLTYAEGTLDVSIDGSRLTGVTATSLPADSKTVMTIKDAIHFGIDLRDFADIKAIDAWYQSNFRNGRFSYDDFIECHFGKYPSHRDNLKPVYLGGYDSDMSVSKVVNTAASSENAPLGTMAAIGSFNSDKSKPIQCDTDEEGFIMGVMWFSIEPVNVQSMASHWMRKLPSDYRIREFANLGVQPIFAWQIAPLQCDWTVQDSEDPKCPYHIVGYNRQYADHIFSMNQMHGDYRTDALLPEVSLRLFEDVPEISPEFLKINWKHLTNMFAAPADADVIKGAIHFDVSVATWMNQSPNTDIQ